jgi:hypothetical protein
MFKLINFEEKKRFERYYFKKYRYIEGERERLSVNIN